MFIKPADQIKIVNTLPWETGCGPATMAMLLGRSYGWVKVRYPDLAHMGTHVEMLRALLIVHTGWHWRTSRAFYKRELQHMTEAPEPMAVLILNYEGGGTSHWIVLHEGKVYDPERKRPATLQAYGNRRRLVAATIQRKKKLESR